MPILTPKQEILLKIAKEKGYITIQDAMSIYSSKAKVTMKRLIKLGLIEEDFTKFGHFKIKQKK